MTGVHPRGVRNRNVCLRPAQKWRRRRTGRTPGRFAPYLSFGLGHLCGDHLFQNNVEAAGDAPVGIIGAQLTQVADVANVITHPVLFAIYPVEIAPGQLLDQVNGFQNGDAVGAPAAQVVDLAGTGIGGKLLHGAYDVVAVNIVPNLFAFIAVNGVSLSRDGNSTR